MNARDVVVRKVFAHSRSLTVTVPRGWKPPEVLNVFLNHSYAIYTPLLLPSAEFVRTVRRRCSRSRGRRYYRVTIPSRAAAALRIRAGSKVLLVRTSIENEFAMIVLPLSVVESLVRGISGSLF